jgi:hypothetical protein
VVGVNLAIASSNNNNDDDGGEEQEQEQEGIESEQTEEAPQQQQQPVYQPNTGSGTITPLNETTSLYENTEYGFNFTFPSGMFEMADIDSVTDLWGR